MLLKKTCRYVPTKACRRMNEVCTELQVSIKSIISKRELAKQKGETHNDDDLLGILTESNSKEIKEQGVGMSIQEVIDECKLFYFAGSETTSNLLVWTMVLLSVHTEWQTSAREEVLKAFGREKPDYDGISHLKKVSNNNFNKFQILGKKFEAKKHAIVYQRQIDEVSF